MTQADMFSDRDFIPRPLARATDPPESLDSADYMSRGNRLGIAQAEALEAVKAFPGYTAREIEDRLHVPGRQIGRRLVELERMGKIERRHGSRCTVTDRPAARWYAK